MKPLTSPRSWAYDANGRLTSLASWGATINYTYDDAGLVISETDINAYANSASNAVTYKRAADGNITSMTYPAGDVPGFNYDDQNRCTGLNGWSTLTFEGEEVVCRALANDVCTQFGYQSNGRVAGLWDHRGGYDPNNTTWPSSNISSRFYGYAPDNQLTWSARAADGGASGSALENNAGENYGYNPDCSVSAFGYARANSDQSANSQGDSNASSANLTATPGVSAPNSYGSSYTYDASGNRSQVTEFGTSVGYSADGENRYAYSLYDGNGDTTNSGVGWTYAYDAEGRMTSATNGSNGAVTTFGYDGLNRLIYQSAGSLQPTIFCYAGKQRIEERSSANNASIYRYFFDGPTTDQITFRQSSSARVYYQYDAQGNTTHLSNDSGQVIEQYLYDAYGTPYVYNAAGTYLGTSSPQDNRYLFRGASAYEWLASPGLYYCRHRMYLPYHGRWLQPDPIGFRGGDVNLYRYCGNDSENEVDANGLYCYLVSHTQFTGIKAVVVNFFCGLVGLGPPVHSFILDIPDNGDPQTSIGFAADGSGQLALIPQNSSNYDATYTKANPGSVYDYQYLGTDSEYADMSSAAASFGQLGPYNGVGLLGGYDSNSGTALVINTEEANGGLQGDLDGVSTVQDLSGSVGHVVTLPQTGSLSSDTNNNPAPYVSDFSQEISEMITPGVGAADPGDSSSDTDLMGMSYQTGLGAAAIGEIGGGGDLQEE